jgi:hypothetical protein
VALEGADMAFMEIVVLFLLLLLFLLLAFDRIRSCPSTLKNPTGNHGSRE